MDYSSSDQALGFHTVVLEKATFYVCVSGIGFEPMSQMLSTICSSC